MNRALLERLNEYQPRKGVASSSSSPFSVFFWFAALSVVAVVVYPTMILINGCSPAVDAQVETAAGAGEYGVKIHECFMKASDGGTFRDFQKCACDVDHSYNLDASSVGATCP